MRSKIITALLATAALGSAGAAAAQPAAAAGPGECSVWSIGRGVLVQSNGYRVALPSQKGTTLSGRAATNGMGGSIQGKVTGDSFRFSVLWDNGSAGVYSGQIDEDGFVDGTTVDRFNRTSRASFRMTTRAICRG